MSESISPIHAAMWVVRDYINDPRRKYALLKNYKFWNQLCASMDAIEYSDHAVEAYLSGAFPEDRGEQYLRVFGLLQSLIVQQDAVRHLYEALSYKNPLDAFAKLKEIREIRNDCSGHPTMRNNGSSHFAFEMQKNRLSVISYPSAGRTYSREIATLSLAQEQQKIVAGILDDLNNVLGAEEKKHRELFKMIKLVDALGVRYPVEKVSEAVHRPADYPLGLIYVAEIKQNMGKFRTALADRGIELDTYDSIKYVYEGLDYVVGEFEKYFQSLKAGTAPRLSQQDAEVFWIALEKHHSELLEMAAEIDNEYSKES